WLRPIRNQTTWSRLCSRLSKPWARQPDRRGPWHSVFETTGWRRVPRPSGSVSFLARLCATPQTTAPMVKSIVPKLFGGAAPANPEVGQALADLARLKKDRPELSVAVALLTETLPGLFARPITENPPDLSPERAAAKLAGGVPLLRGENIKLDGETFRRRWLHVCKVMERQQDKSTARSMASALKRGQLHPLELTAALLSGNPDDVYTHADRLGLDAEMTAGLLRLTLFPVLAQMNTALLAFRQGGRWEKGHCPTCGSWPLLGEFRGLEQMR